MRLLVMLAAQLQLFVGVEFPTSCCSCVLKARCVDLFAADGEGVTAGPRDQELSSVVADGGGTDVAEDTDARC